MMRTLRSVAIACEDGRFLLRPQLANVRSVEATVEVMTRVLDAANGLTVPCLSMVLSSGADQTVQRLFGQLIEGRVPKLELMSSFRGAADVTFSSPQACGAVVAMAVGESGASVKFSCRAASIRGEATRGALVLRVSSSTPEAEQRQFVEQLPERIARVELSVEGDAPTPFDRLRARVSEVRGD